ncbi:glycoside hydrolase family 28 protein [candidate division KSB1 bacterium]|nr:glycoside hydrolase family 28 protein [candidate division KSB1 bacterium]
MKRWLKRVFSRMFITVILIMIIFYFNLNAQSNLQLEVHACLKNIPFKMSEIQLPEFPERSFNIVDYGAVGDGHTLNTDAIHKAVEICAQSGGGKVIVPSGMWLTGPIRLESNINLHLKPGALILFTPDHTQYPIIKAPERGFNVASPVYGFNLENIAITGDGILDGSGESWRPVKKFKTTESQWKALVNSGGVVEKEGKIWWHSQEAMDGAQYLKRLKASKRKKELTAEDYLPAREYLRPYMVLLINCKKVLLDGVTVKNSPKFALVPNWCEDVVIRDVKVNNEWWAQNGDGIDINCGKNVLIYKCKVTAGDDGICMKSGMKKNSNEPALSNIVISDCIVYHGHGGFVIGSNTDAGMKNIYIKNCNFIGTDVGLRFKSGRDRGGLVESIHIKNIYMKDIVNEAILFDTHYENTGAFNQVVPVTETTPRFEKFYMDSVYCVGAKQAVLVAGLPEMPIQDITMTNMAISSEKGFESLYAANFVLKNVKIKPKQGEVYSLNQSKKFLIENGFCPKNTNVFMKVKGKDTKSIRVMKTDLSSAKIAVEYGDNSNKDAVFLE